MRFYKSVLISVNLWLIFCCTPALAATELKQSTAVTVKIGPFTDISDGTTRETALVILQGSVYLSKAGGAMAVKNDANTSAHDALGVYNCKLDTNDTGTAGMLRLDVNDINAVPVWAEFMVLEPNAYDAKYAGYTSGVQTALTAYGASTFNPFTTDVNLSPAGLDDVNVLDPNTDPNNWDYRDWMVYSAKRWGNKTELDHSTNIFTTYNSAGVALVEQPVTEANNIETIERVVTP